MINKGLTKGFSILTAFSRERPSLSLGKIATLFEMPKPTALRILNSLEELSFVTRTPDKKYKLGVGLLYLGNLVKEQLDLHKVAVPYMSLLCEQTGLAVRLVVRQGVQVIFVDKAEPATEVIIYNMVGIRLQLYQGSSARTLLSFLPVRQREELLERIREEDNLPEEQIEHIRRVTEKENRQGYTLSYQERTPGTAGMGMPLRDYTGDVIGGLSLAGLLVDFSEDRLPYLEAKLRETTERISVKLGYRKDSLPQ